MPNEIINHDTLWAQGRQGTLRQKRFGKAQKIKREK
jgi:hypothetical protein